MLTNIYVAYIGQWLSINNRLNYPSILRKFEYRVSENTYYALPMFNRSGNALIKEILRHTQQENSKIVMSFQNLLNCRYSKFLRSVKTGMTAYMPLVIVVKPFLTALEICLHFIFIAKTLYYENASELFLSVNKYSRHFELAKFLQVV